MSNLASSTAAAVAMLGVVLATPAMAAVGDPPPAHSLHQAIAAIARHHTRAADALIAQVSGELATANPAAPALANLRFARQALRSGHADGAMQDLYAALPLVRAAA